MSNELEMEDVVYFSHCFYCMKLFDDSEHDPKYLSCHHTFCVKCLKVLSIVFRNMSAVLRFFLFTSDCHQHCDTEPWNGTYLPTL